MRDEFYPLIAEPGPDSWADILRLLGAGTPSPDELAQLADELRAWPVEVERKLPAQLSLRFPDPIVRRVRHEPREVDLYNAYLAAAAGAIALSDGRPAVRLQRAFSGALQGAHGRVHRIGVAGQGDLCGSLCVEFQFADPTCQQCSPPPGHDPAGCGRHADRVAVALEVEVKRAAGRQSPAQRQREEALRARGEIYLLVRSTADMVRALRTERDRVLAALG